MLFDAAAGADECAAGVVFPTGEGVRGETRVALFGLTLSEEAWE
jgi:hypothetical protein